MKPLEYLSVAYAEGLFKGLGRVELGLILAFLHHGDRDGMSYASARSIARRLGTSQQHVYTARRKLIEIGLVRVVEGGRTGRATTVQLVLPAGENKVRSSPKSGLLKSEIGTSPRSGLVRDRDLDKSEIGTTNSPESGLPTPHELPMNSPAAKCADAMSMVSDLIVQSFDNFRHSFGGRQRRKLQSIIEMVGYDQAKQLAAEAQAKCDKPGVPIWLSWMETAAAGHAADAARRRESAKPRPQVDHKRFEIDWSADA